MKSDYPPLAGEDVSRIVLTLGFELQISYVGIII